jgi:H+-transporting ATPase
VSAKPIRWRMPRLLSVAAVLGLFSIVESFGLLLIGIRVLLHPNLQPLFGPEQRKSASNNDVSSARCRRPPVAVYHRSERWFFLPPFPAVSLFLAIFLTQLVAVLMCRFGLLVPAIPWTLIGWVWAYNIGWMFILCAVPLATEHLAAGRTARWMRSASLVNQPMATA